MGGVRVRDSTATEPDRKHPYACDVLLPLQSHACHAFNFIHLQSLEVLIFTLQFSACLAESCRWQCCKDISVDMILQGVERLGNEHGSLLAHVRVHLSVEIFSLAQFMSRTFCKEHSEKWPEVGCNIAASSLAGRPQHGTEHTCSHISRVHLGCCHTIDSSGPDVPTLPRANHCKSLHPVRACKHFPKPN